MQFEQKALICVPLCLILVLSPYPLLAEKIKGDNVHARKWNKFANDVLLLHKKLLKKKKTSEYTKTGGYFGNPEFYIEETFTDLENGELISRVLWEREDPDNLHTIEVFIRDKHGRIIREYSAAYLPTYRNAPTQTLITLYAYNADLEAYRMFDAHGVRLGERCTGIWNGQRVDLMLDEDEIIDALHGFSDRMEKKDYKACFKGLPVHPGKFLTPQ